jgi:hypothetical protein
LERKKWLVLLAAVVVVAVMLGASASGQTLQKVRLSEVVRSVFYAPQYVALSLGFFEEEGLEVELQTAWGADKGAAALISGAELHQALPFFQGAGQGFFAEDVLASLKGLLENAGVEIGGGADVHQIHIYRLQQLFDTTHSIYAVIPLGLGLPLGIGIRHHHQLRAGDALQGLAVHLTHGAVTYHSHSDQADHLA